MRDLLLAVFVFCALPFALRRPWIGVILFTWLSLMNPHKLAWGFAHDWPFAEIVALATMAGMVFGGKDQWRFTWGKAQAVMLAFWAWTIITTLFAAAPEAAALRAATFSKVLLMLLITTFVLNERKQMEWFVWVMVVSLGFYGVKGGLFTILTGGGMRVQGPEGTNIGDNNDIGMALIMTIPLMRYLMLSAGKKAQVGLGAAMALTAFAAIGTHSRGTLVAGVAMVAMLWGKGGKKVVWAFLLGALVVGIALFMPENWYSRMGTIQTYEEDGSATGRINAWYVAANVAAHNILGGGFEYNVNPEFFIHHEVIPNTTVRAAHSMYFQVLGEHGFIGLVLLVAFWILVWRSMSFVQTTARTNTKRNLTWVGDLATMIKVSLVGYFVGGAFLSRAYFDLALDVAALALVLAAYTRRTVSQSMAREQPRGVGVGLSGAPTSARI